MFFGTRTTRLLVRILNLSKCCATCEQRRSFIASDITFFSKLLDIPARKETRKFLKDNESFRGIDRNSIRASFNYLTGNGIPTAVIRKYPKVLLSDETVLRNRYEILNECGCSSVNIFYFIRFGDVLNKSENDLKKMGVIDNEINLQRKLADCLNVKLLRCEDNLSLKAVRLHILKIFYLKNKFMTASQFDYTMSDGIYTSQKSYKSIMETLKILIDQFDIPKNEIQFNCQVLLVDPFNLKKLLTIHSIGGKDIVKILRENPNLMRVPYKHFLNSLAALRNLGYSDEMINQRPSVLSLDPSTINVRDANLRSLQLYRDVEFDPKMLQLIMYPDVKSMFDGIQKSNKKCFSVSSLTKGEKFYKRFLLKESDKYSTRICMNFFSKILEADKEKLKEMKHHPYWDCIPLAHVKQTIKQLQRAGFALDDIRDSMHISLYSWETIEKQLEKCQATKQIGGVPLENVHKSTQLKLILYNIEFEFKFSGDGVWEGH